MKRYRIVTDAHAGYEAQVWRLWWPFWVQMGCINTHSSVERAEEYINNRKQSGTVVKDVS